MIRMIKNNWFMLKYLYKARKEYIFWEIGKSIWNSATNLVTIYLFKVLIDMLVGKKELINIIPIILAYAILKKGYDLLFEYMMQIELPKAKYALEKIITEDIMTKALTIDLECYDNTDFYNKYTKALAETGGRAIAALNVISTFIFHIISMIGLMSLIFILEPFAIVLATFYFFSSLIFINKNKEYMFERDMDVIPYNRHADYCKSVFFSRESAKDLRIHNGIAGYFKDKYVESLNSAEQKYMNVSGKIYINDIVRTIALIITEMILPLTYFSHLYLQGSITIGSVTALWESTLNLANNANGFFYIYSNLKQSSLYIENLKYILKYVPKIHNVENVVSVPKKINEIRFVNLTFAYPGSQEKVLKNVNLTINAKQKVAFVGHNGAGKSTLIKLLLRLYDPSEGYIAINGIDIRKFDLSEYRALFATMFQDFSLFSAPISVNVAMKKNIHDEDEQGIIDSLTKVGLYEKIINEPKGIHSYYTKVFDDNGILLSGGEMQKLALARNLANVNKSLIGIYDEPSSALDPESESVFYDNILKMLNTKILIFISHRLSTTCEADMIYLLEEGSVVESGNHDELMKIDGKYAHIFRLQAERYKYDLIQDEILHYKYN